MKTIRMTNPTDIAGVEEYTEMFWVPSIGENRNLSVWREATGTYAYEYNGEHSTGFTTGQAAYKAGVATVQSVTPDATAAVS